MGPDDENLVLSSTAKFSVLDISGAEEKPNASSKSKQQGSNTRATGPTKHTLKDGDLNLDALATFDKEEKPAWIKDRESLYDDIKARQMELWASKNKVDVKVTLPDGKVLDAVAWETTPYDLAAKISQGLADASCVAKITYSDFVSDYDAAESGDAAVDVMMEHEDENKGDADASVQWDMMRPIVGNISRLEFCKFDSDEGRTTFWHSSAHVLGEALEMLIGAHLTIGPPLSGGFYYDAFMGSEVHSEADYEKIAKTVNQIVKKKQKFERLVVTKEEALGLFKHNPFKQSIIQSKVEGNTTVYKCGEFIDLCRGPHVRSTGVIKAFSCAKHSSTNWLGDVTQPSLQRMYGISFPDKKMLKAWQHNLKLQKERDHRLIGKKQDLFFFHELSPGSAFFLPHGARIYNKLVEFIRGFYHEKDYTEVITPNVFNLDLWHQSGHALHYKDAMFIFDVEGQEWGMKPMNCPAHCLMYKHKPRSHRDLPMRFADFGVLHRNELSGALTGLTRVRRFQQDDGHIFCTAEPEMIQQEVLGSLQFMKQVYDIFGMSYKLELSTRPAKALGEKKLWDMAEKSLAKAMDDFIGVGNWRVNPGDGAFYGPKVDIKVMDAMERVHQCATIQLDFQLPIRFDLTYQSGDTSIPSSEVTRPVIVHRAMLGSVERMFAVLCEHYGGKWPLWLSPRQVMLIPVHKDFIPYCEEVKKMLHDRHFYVDVASGRETFQKKVRNAQLAQYNYQLVVGKAEVESRSVNVRTRENKVEGEISLDDLITKLESEVREYK